MALKSSIFRSDRRWTVDLCERFPCLVLISGAFPYGLQPWATRSCREGGECPDTHGTVSYRRATRLSSDVIGYSHINWWITRAALDGCPVAPGIHSGSLLSLLSIPNLGPPTYRGQSGSISDETGVFVAPSDCKLCVQRELAMSAGKIKVCTAHSRGCIARTLGNPMGMAYEYFNHACSPCSADQGRGCSRCQESKDGLLYSRSRACVLQSGCSSGLPAQHR